jgi:hypothetical protein
MARTWSDAVRLLRELDGRETAAQFEVGDIVLEQAPLSQDGVNNGGYEVIQRLSDETGISFNTLIERRKVASRFTPNVRTLGVSYSVFVTIAVREDPSERQRLLEMIATTPATSKSGRWTVDLLRQYLGVRPTRFPPPEEATPESKRAAFADLAADPDVVTEAARFGSPTSRALGELERQRDTLRQEAQERATQSDPVLKRIDQLVAAIDVEEACRRFATDLSTMTERFAREIDGALPRTGPAREQPLTMVRWSITQARAALDRLEAYTESGSNDLDAFLSEVLGGKS